MPNLMDGLMDGHWPLRCILRCPVRAEGGTISAGGYSLFPDLLTSKVQQIKKFHHIHLDCDICFSSYVDMYMVKIVKNLNERTSDDNEINLKIEWSC